jgi:hypothetical protein
VSIEQDADRSELKETFWRIFHEAGRAEVNVADALLDADDLLIVDLRCPTCEGGYITGDCVACRGTGRRTVEVVAR